MRRMYNGDYQYAVRVSSPACSHWSRMSGSRTLSMQLLSYQVSQRTVITYTMSAIRRRNRHSIDVSVCHVNNHVLTHLIYCQTSSTDIARLSLFYLSNRYKYIYIYIYIYISNSLLQTLNLRTLVHVIWRGLCVLDFKDHNTHPLFF